MTIEAMKQALEALESATPKYTRQRADQKTLGGALDYWKLEQHQRLKAITSLRQAIAEAEKHEVSQEPVAWIEHEWSGSGLRHLHFERREQSLRDEVVNPIWTPLYTHPQPKREPLTVEQLREHWQVAKVLDMTDAEIDFADYVLIARDVEALYGIKGEA